MYHDCIFFNSVYKLDKSINCKENVCSNCKIIKKYKELVKFNKIDIVKDMATANFRHNKHRNNKEG